MRYLLLSLIILSSATHIHIDNYGLQNLANFGIRFLEGQSIHLDIDFEKVIKIKTPKIQLALLTLHGLDVYGINTDPGQIKFVFNSRLNSIDFFANLNEFYVSSDIKLQIFGANTINDLTKIRIRGTKIYGKLQLSSNGQALKVDLVNSQFDKFKFGKMKLVSGNSILIKTLQTVESAVLNDILFAVKGLVAKQLASIIHQQGSSIPSQINLPSPLEQIAIDFPLLQDPQVTKDFVFVDFDCGGEKLYRPQGQRNYVQFAIGQQCINKILYILYQVPGVVDVKAIAQQLSDIMEINSHSLQEIFPLLIGQQKKDVEFEIQLDNSNNGFGYINVREGLIEASVPVKANVNLIDLAVSRKNNYAPFSQRLKSIEEISQIPDSEQFYTAFEGVANVQVIVDHNAGGFHVDILTIDLSQIKADEPEKLNVKAFESKAGVLLKFARSYANQVIYQQMISPSQYVQGLPDELFKIELEDGLIKIRLQF